MAVLVRIISNNATWIYLACLLAALYLLRSALLARRERQQAAFQLERETALNRTHSTLRWAILLMVVMGLTYFVANTLAVAVEPIIAEADPTPTPVFLLDTPTPTPEATLPPTETPTITPTPRPRATPRPVETPTPALPPTPAAPAVVAPSCPDSRAVIIEPGMGQRVNGPVGLIGTAQSENFEYFKIEFKAAGAPGVLLSGSGATVFALVEDVGQGERIRRDLPGDLWSRLTWTLPDGVMAAHGFLEP